MPRSDWRRYDQLVIALGVAAVGFFLLVVTWELSATNASYTREADQAAKAYAESTQAEQGFKTAQYDLAEQRRMAFWAQWSFIVSLFASGITGVGIYFVWRTLVANIAAVETANKAIESEREIGEAQVRAYLGAKEPGIGFDDLRPVFKVGLHNTGNSPAMFLQATCRIVFDPFNLDASAECKPIRLFLGALSSGEASNDLYFSFNARISDHPSVNRTPMVVRVIIDLEWINVFHREDGAYISYLVRINRPLSDTDRKATISPEGMTLGKRLQAP